MAERLTKIAVETSVAKLLGDIRATQIAVESAGVYTPNAIVTQEDMEVAADSVDVTARVTHYASEAEVITTRNARVTQEDMEVAAYVDRDARVTHYIIEVLVPVAQPPPPIPPAGWAAWGPILSRITNADFKQVHRYRGIGESEKLNRVSKGSQTDVQTGFLQTKYLEYLTDTDAQSGEASVSENIRDLQHCRVQILWRVQNR